MTRKELEISEYVKVVKKRRWTVASVFLAVFLSVAVYTFTARPIYEATSVVYIDPGVVTQYTFQQAQSPIDNPSYIQTQIGILRSESIARTVVAKAGLAGAAQEKAGVELLLANVLDSLGPGFRPDQEDDNVGDAVRVFHKKLGTEALKNSNLVKVSYKDEDPALAAKVVNETVSAYIERNLEMKVAPAREAMAWLNTKLGDIKSRMTVSASQLQDFKREKGLIVTGDKQMNISLQALSDLTSKSLAATARKSEAEVRYQQVQKLAKTQDGLMSLPAVINNKLIQDLKAQESLLNKEAAANSKKYGDKHPKMISLSNERDVLKQQIKNEADLIVASLKNEYETSRREEQAVRAALSQQKGEAMSYERRSTEYDLMKQDVQGSTDIYDAVLKKFQESDLMGKMNMTSVQLLDKATPPNRPVRPRKALNLILGVIIGSLGGIGFAFLFEYIDSTYKSPEDVEEHLALPFLGMVPRINELKKTVGTATAKPFAVNPKSTVAEAFRNIRSNILLSTGDTNPKVIQVCSPIHSEGKSLVSLNTSCIMAAAGEKVLLIDGDMRKPSLHKALGLPHSNGLSSILAMQASLESVITPTGINNLSFISSGPISPNPGELIGSNRMAEIIKSLRGTYDRVIIDCPPYLGIADASILTPLTDGILLVVRSEITSKEAAMKATKGMSMINAKILGVVLNDLSSKSESQYYYNYNYGHYNN